MHMHVCIWIRYVLDRDAARAYTGDVAARSCSGSYRESTSRSPICMTLPSAPFEAITRLRTNHAVPPTTASAPTTISAIISADSDGAKVPAGHDWVDAHLSARVASGQKKPSGHGADAVAPAGQYAPTEHGTGACVPATQKYPASHAPAPADELEPGGQ